MRKLNNKKSKDGHFNIPKLELEKFKFSPPGPMGWSFAEYEKMLEIHEKIVLNESAVEENLANLEGRHLKEYPSGLLAGDETNSKLENVGDVDSTLQNENDEGLSVDPVDLENEKVIEENESESSHHKNQEETEEDKMKRTRGTKEDLLKFLNEEKQSVNNDKHDEQDLLVEKDVEEKPENSIEEKDNKQTDTEEEISNKVIVPNDINSPPWLASKKKKSKSNKKSNKKTSKKTNSKVDSKKKKDKTNKKLNKKTNSKVDSKKKKGKLNKKTNRKMDNKKKKRNS